MMFWRGPGDPGRTTPTRLRVRPWRDPRLLAGVLLVVGATVLGARLAATADDTVEYWVAGDAVRAGDDLTGDALEPGRVRLPADAHDLYLPVDDPLEAPIDELAWAHDVPEGTLVPRSALVPRSVGTRSELPLGVAPGAFPADLAAGDVVDVWVGPSPGDETGKEAVRALESVRVVSADAEAIGGSSGRTVLVDVEAAALRPVVISTVSSGHVTIVRKS